MEDGWRVTVICPRGSSETTRAMVESLDGIRILRYPQRAATGLAGYLIEYLPSFGWSLAWLLAVALTARVDVIHGCNPPDLFFLLGRLGRYWGARYVYDQHDVNPELAEAKWGRRRFRSMLVRLTRTLEGASYRTADLVIVPNESYRALALTRGQVQPTRLEVVRNAPPDGFRDLARGSRPPGDGVFRIGYLGVMGSQDGVELLIDAAADLASRRPDLQFHVDLIGDGESRHALEARATSAGLSSRVSFHGYQQAESFVPILAATDVCVSPDPPSGFNNVSTMTKVVEYLAIGRPVIAYDLDETRRLVGDAGWIVGGHSSDALSRRLETCADSPDAVTRTSRRAAARFGELAIDWERSTRVLQAAYRRLLGVPFRETRSPHRGQLSKREPAILDVPSKGAHPGRSKTRRPALATLNPGVDRPADAADGSAR